jgi:large subunit ribosomal protein L4
MPSATRARSPRAAKTSAPQAPKLGGGTVKLDSNAFGARFNMNLVHETVRAELAARRRGTASTKTRGEVSGGGAKPWRQKGTGRARAGSSRSPVWTGGGVVFGPTPRRYTFKINRKERQAALRSVLSAHAQRDSMAVFDAGAFDAPSTAQAVNLLNDWDPAEPVLVVLGAEEAAAGKSFRNIARTEALPLEDVGVADVIGAASLLVSEVALPGLVARSAGREREQAAEPAEEAQAAAPVEEPEAAAPAEAPEAREPEAAAPAEELEAGEPEAAAPAEEPEAEEPEAEELEAEEPEAEEPEAEATPEEPEAAAAADEPEAEATEEETEA